MIETQEQQEVDEESTKEANYRGKSLYETRPPHGQFFL